MAGVRPETSVRAPAIAGLVATQMATIVGYFLNLFGLPQLNWPAVNGSLVLPGGSPGAQFAAGAFVHHVDGVVFALLFVILVWRMIPFPNTSAGNVGKGLIYSVVLSHHQHGLPRAVRVLQEGRDRSVQLRLPFPLPQPSSAPPETFPLYTDIGWKLPFVILVWHLPYGFFLGALYDPSTRNR